MRLEPQRVVTTRCSMTTNQTRRPPAWTAYSRRGEASWCRWLPRPPIAVANLTRRSSVGTFPWRLKRTSPPRLLGRSGSTSARPARYHTPSVLCHARSARLPHYDTTMTHFFPSAFFGVLHEAGHGMYEQGLRSDVYGLPPGTPASLGIHESQSRLWENQVGRSGEFWQHFFPLAQQSFPAALADVKLAVFHAALNQVRRSLIRVEADEATYNLHIVIRFELERALLDGDLSVRDLPGAWRDRYTEDLGVTPPTDADGVLQDIHWSAGLFGYFPTYSLGNLCAAQFFEQALREVPDLRRKSQQASSVSCWAGCGNRFTSSDSAIPRRSWCSA